MVLPGNSHKARKDEKTIKKYEGGEVRLRERGPIETIGRSFLSESIETVGRYLVLEVIIPALKNAVSDVVTTGIDMLLFGESRKSSGKKSTGFGVINYTNFSQARRPERDDIPFRINPKRYEDIVMPSKEDAENVLNMMADVIEEYGAISLADLYEMVGFNSDYTDQRYGWTDIGKTVIRRVREGYLLEFPSPTVLN